MSVVAKDGRCLCLCILSIYIIDTCEFACCAFCACEFVCGQPLAFAVLLGRSITSIQYKVG